MSSNQKKIGLITTTSLVVGNMIGAGIFLLPASLAKYGSISLLGWLFTATGAIILAKIFSNLVKSLSIKVVDHTYILKKDLEILSVFSRLGLLDFLLDKQCGNSHSYYRSLEFFLSHFSKQFYSSCYRGFKYDLVFYLGKFKRSKNLW